MNTQQIMTMTQVVEATGETRAEIYRAQELGQLGAPAHFGYRGGEQVYSGEGVALLALGLEQLGRPTAGQALRAAWNLRTAPATRSGGRGWLGCWQDRAERGAA